MNTLQAFIAVTAVLAGLTTAPRQADADDFVVLCNRGNGPASMDADDLRRIFTGRTRQWDSGAVVQTMIVPSEAAPETAYLAAQLSMSVRDLLTRIQQEVFRGEMRRPVVIRSSQECLAALRANPGGICVANASVAGSLPAGIAVVHLGH